MTRKCILICLSLVMLAALALGCVACTVQTDKEKISNAIEQAEKRIADYRQTNAAFADTLMYFLPKSCVYDVESGHLIFYKDKFYTYSDTLEESTEEYVVYANLQKAATAENQLGQTVYTLSYYTKYDGGCACYTIGESAAEIAEPCGSLYLNYTTAQNKVSLRQMGWKGDDLWGYQQRFEHFTQITTLVFPKGDYPLLDAVRTDRDNVNYFGIEATVYSEKNFGGDNNKVYNALWSVRKTWSSTKFVDGQTYSGINFTMRHGNYNPQRNDLKGLAYLMQVAYCRNLQFYNCNYIIPKGTFGNSFEDLTKYPSTCFDCFSAWFDLKFDGCTFENHTYSKEGGSIAFRDVYNVGCENLTFTNNRVLTSPRDEGVAIFAGWDKRFHEDNPVLGEGYIKHCLLKGNHFIAEETAEGLDPRTMFLTVGYQLSPVYDINYIDNTFDGYCNTYFLHYCYCYGLTFRGNTVNIRQTGDASKMFLIYHNDSPDAGDVLVEDNVFNLLGDNFHLGNVTITSPYSDASELTFRNNTINLAEGSADKVIASNATVQNNLFNLNKTGSIYYRTWGNVSNNTYNVKVLEKSVFEFYDADVKHDLVLKQENVCVDVAKSNLLMFNGTKVKFNGHSLTVEDVRFDVKLVDRDNYHLCWSSDGITDTVVPIVFRRCFFGAYEGHLQIVNGQMHTLTIEE